MAKALETIKQLVDAAKQSPAVEGEPACNKGDVKWCVEGYTPDRLRSDFSRRVKAVDASKPQDRMNVLSLANLQYMQRYTERIIQEAIAKHGEEAVDRVVAKAMEVCEPCRMHLTHTPFWEASSHSQGDDSLKAALKDKALKAPSLTVRSDEGNLVCFDAVVADGFTPTDPEPLFIIAPTEADWKRSLAILAFNDTLNHIDNSVLAVGGNHLRAAWVMATIANMLGINCTREDFVEHEAISTLSEVKIPEQISLIGQKLWRDGEEETINPRAKPKPRAKEKRDIKPDKGNPDLRNEGQARDGVE